MIEGNRSACCRENKFSFNFPPFTQSGESTDVYSTTKSIKPQVVGFCHICESTETMMYKHWNNVVQATHAFSM